MVNTLLERMGFKSRDADLHSLARALAVVVPTYLVLSLATNAMLAARISWSLERMPDGVQVRVQERLDAQPRGVGTFLIGLIDPPAARRMRMARATVAALGSDAPVLKAELPAMRRSLGDSIIAKFFGFEQLICYVLAAWAVVLLRTRLASLRDSESELERDPLALERGQLIDPETAAELHQPLLTARNAGVAPNLCLVLSRALLRFEVAQDVASAESVVTTEAGLLADARDADLGLARFAIWAIPSVGFIGTARGLGSALAVADSPDNISEIVSHLAIAFDTTLIALLLSIIVMYLLHHYQRLNDSMTDRLIRRCDDILISHLTTATPPLAEVAGAGGDRS